MYATGTFVDVATFGPFNLETTGTHNDVFVTKLASDGGFVWARSFSGDDVFGGAPEGIAVDNSGNVYTSGVFHGTVDFDPGPAVAAFTSAGATNMFVSKLNSAGDFVWARQYGGTSGAGSGGVALDSAGNVYMAGYFNDSIDVDPGPGTLNLTSSGQRDIFVTKLDPSGSLVWARHPAARPTWKTIPNPIVRTDPHFYLHEPAPVSRLSYVHEQYTARK